MIGYAFRMLTGKSAMQKKLKQHFGRLPVEETATTARTFPLASRVDVQLAIDHFFATRGSSALLGIHSAIGHEAPTLAHLFTRGPFPVDVGPLQHDDIDVGEPSPVRCLKNGLWLAHQLGMPFAVLLSPAIRYGMVGGVHVELAVPKGERGLQFSESDRSHEQPASSVPSKVPERMPPNGRRRLRLSKELESQMRWQSSLR
jgi:hypothetical protein